MCFYRNTCICIMFKKISRRFILFLLIKIFFFVTEWNESTIVFVSVGEKEREFMFVCVWERERERERGGEGLKLIKRKCVLKYFWGRPTFFFQVKGKGCFEILLLFRSVSGGAMKKKQNKNESEAKIPKKMLKSFFFIKRGLPKISGIRIKYRASQWIELFVFRICYLLKYAVSMA